ncbi:ATP-binding protein [Actinomadura logoneensis]|uniref:ATP-binding protein n=1 Tax=Actinomadura logoneensis TaxID=2293572 RepID=A0A372JJG0_9ACTN|nr:ATP-binding protein [Actinomadura logoneensis]RFU39438.1 ATP-binding protein [Actinomadura logoneensis]
MSLELCPLVEPSVLRWCRAFPGEAVQAAAVRRFVALLLDGCPVLDDVLLAADELVVNAVRHTKSGRPDGVFTVELRRGLGMVAVAVRDQGGPTEPIASDAGDYAESGRGLRTVSALATRWGWFGNDKTRTVTAVFTDTTSWTEAA